MCLSSFVFVCGHLRSFVFLCVAFSISRFAFVFFPAVKKKNGEVMRLGSGLLIGRIFYRWVPMILFDCTDALVDGCTCKAPTCCHSSGQHFYPRDHGRVLQSAVYVRDQHSCIPSVQSIQQVAECARFAYHHVVHGCAQESGLYQYKSPLPPHPWDGRPPEQSNRTGHPSPLTQPKHVRTQRGSGCARARGQQAPPKANQPTPWPRANPRPRSPRLARAGVCHMLYC